ncbi:MAG: YicC/YloC family endoribonuclease, partial [Haemophilus parahaemolyticus]|nr:YicC/YloC family endoribonuclease [Haemophilus parahaemolyticus]
MIYSMTAFAHLEIKKEWGNAVWEIRYVNQRFLETYFRLPEAFRHLEMGLRERLRNSLTRGKVECSLRVELAQASNSKIALNNDYAEQVITSLKTLQSIAGEGEINLVDVLRYPGVVDTQSQDLDQIAQDLLAGFEQILADFIAMRGREGE